MTIGVAIVGAGMIGKLHASAFSEICDVKLCGVYNRNIQKAELLATQYKAKVYKNYNELLADSEVNLVSLCLPPNLHVDYGLQAGAARKHLIVEKPMDINLEKAKELIAIYKKQKLTLSVIFQNRFTPAAQRVKDALKKGMLGKLILGDAYVKWFRSPEYYTSNSWRGTWAVEGGAALINQTIHTIDLLQWFMGGVKDVSGRIVTSTHNIEAEDLGLATVQFNNGALGVIEGSTAIYPGYKERIEIHGTKGSIKLEGGIVTGWNVAECNEQEFLDSQKISYGETNSPAITNINHKAQFQNVVEAIKSGNEPLVNGEEGLKSLKIVLAIYESARTGRIISLR